MSFESGSYGSMWSVVGKPLALVSSLLMFMALLALLTLAAVAPARGEEAPPAASVPAEQGSLGRLPAHETLVSIPAITNLRVTPRGPAQGGGNPFSSRACNIISTHTNANFSGGSYVAQAGFAQNEMLAQTYTLAATDFPIKIDLSEAIFVTSGANTQTVTQWSILFYEGDANTGTLVHESSSDDVILPHLRVGPGTAGVNIQFSVDPMDPEQIIIQNNGTNRFTVAWRINHHNQQTGNPCFTAPPTCCNAFPCTDTNGLQQPANNWVFGVNCGALGCPPNGGWARFSSLATFCRPTGDAVMRTTWSSVACTPGIGACCLPSGVCQVLTTTDCATGNGTYQGDGTDCASVSCPQPTGACCFTNNGCVVLTSPQCVTAAGVWLGANTTCASGNTCPRGRCCLPSGQCSVLTQTACVAQGGAFAGVGTNCTGANCPQPTGACCLNGGTSCLVLTGAQCNVIPGGMWLGANIPCTQCGPQCDTIDFNRDGVSPDSSDVDDFLSVFSGGPCSTGMCGDIDFNNDSVSPDSDDIDAFLRVFSGGSC